MGRHQVETFATAADLEAVLRAVEEAIAVHYFLPAVSEPGGVLELTSIGHLEAVLDRADGPATALLVLELADQFVVREVPQRGGGVARFVDQLHNPGSVSIRTGGLAGEGILLPGQIGTISDAPASLQLFARYQKEIRSRFQKVKSYWVGPGAMEVLDGGGRLTSTPRGPSEYDLKR